MPANRAGLIVRASYALADSARYRRAKQLVYDVLENPNSRIKPAFDVFMIVIVLASVFLLIYEVKNDLGPGGLYFERIVVTIFIIEYLGRLWVWNDSHLIVINHYERSEIVDERFRLWPALREVLRTKREYVTTPLAIIDLLAIIPSYRPIRVLRVFLLFRLFKLFRYARSVNEFVKVLSDKRFEFYTLGIFLGFVVFTAATAIFVFEGRAEDSKIQTFFDAIYWALVTISTVGYGDITPQTSEGRFITLVLIISGIGVISFSTSIVVAAFSEKMRELSEHRVFAAVEKMVDFTVVCGFGRVGQEVCERMAAARLPFVVIDSDRENVELARRRGYPTIEGDATESELMENLGIKDRVTRILSLTDSDVSNVYITVTARFLNPEVEIIARANRGESVRKLSQAGADQVVTPFSMVGFIAAEFIGQPVAFEAMYGILSGDRPITVEAIVARKSSYLDGRRLGDIDFRLQRLVLFGVVCDERDGDDATGTRFRVRNRHFQFNPPADFVIRGGDVLILFGHEFSIFHFKKIVERKGH